MPLSRIEHTPERVVRVTLKGGERRALNVGFNDRANRVLWIINDDCNFPISYDEIAQVSVPLNA